ncbi:hypothetical protein IV203_031554 [Nitzschia inconspicua]|uniref:Uncharacterized protein n=1 Tax=Nitzschia inconspicua TaxID=303405 RepID=A0A9K3LXA5_9STRA|nr:hypothetical protein IV203_031554 [Nitzschia inconspicua]
MKLSLFASAATLLASTLPFGSSAQSLRSAMTSGVDENGEEQAAKVFFQASDKYIDTSGMWVTKEDIETEDAVIVTPFYQSSNGFVVPDEKSTFLEGQLDSIVGAAVDGGLRSGFVKYRIGGMDAEKWSAIDIADFDSAIHEAANFVHGRKDGIFFAGEKIYKIKKIRATTEDNNGQADSDLTNMAQVGRKTKYGSNFFEPYTKVGFTCRYCPDDDATNYDEYAIVQSSNDPIFNKKSLDAIATKACEILSTMGNSDFAGATECSGDVVSPDEVARVLTASVDQAEGDNVVGAASSAVLA